jgi:hypothetical protein
MSTKADVPDHPGLMAHALIERDAELLVTDPDRMAMAHEIGGRDHEREAFRQADRILYLNPRTARGDIAHRAVSAAATAERKRALFENSVSTCCSPLNHGPVSETKRDAVHSAAKLRTIKFNSGCACTAVQISFTTMGGIRAGAVFPASHAYSVRHAPMEIIMKTTVSILFPARDWRLCDPVQEDRAPTKLLPLQDLFEAVQ